MTVNEITPSDAHAAIIAGAFLLDVRNDDEWAAGHAPAAHYVTLNEVAARLDEIPQDRDIVVVCRAGGRSLKAAEFLVSNGYRAENLTGGMQAWAADGLDVVNSTGAAGEVI
jgi:rhodanese-related sulfurtransferase